MVKNIARWLLHPNVQLARLLTITVNTQTKQWPSYLSQLWDVSGSSVFCILVTRKLSTSLSSKNLTPKSHSLSSQCATFQPKISWLRLVQDIKDTYPCTRTTFWTITPQRHTYTKLYLPRICPINVFIFTLALMFHERMIFLQKHFLFCDWIFKINTSLRRRLPPLVIEVKQTLCHSYMHRALSLI